MKNSLILCLLFFSCISFSQNTQKDISDQQSAREWNYYSYFSGKEARISSYFDLNILSGLKKTISKLLITLESSSSIDLKLFYPGLDLDSSDDRISLILNLTTESNLIDILENWGDFREVVSTDRWLDVESGSCVASDPIGNDDCGRKTRGAHVLNSLSLEQLEGLSALKSVVHEDFQYILNHGDIEVGAEIIRIYQFLFDFRSIDNLMNYGLLGDSETIGDEDKIIQIELIRSYILQMFSSSGGLVQNSNFVEIKLEDQSCYITPDNHDIDCQNEYVKNLLYTDNPYTTKDAKNLIFDTNSIEGLLSYYINIYKVDNELFVDEARVQSDFLRMYHVLASIYSIDMRDPKVSSSNKKLLISYLKKCNIYLLTNPTTIGLQVAKSIEKLILTVEVAL